MLILSRKSGERILLGNDIEVVVLEVRGDRVKLGFNAPRYVAIRRGELLGGMRGGIPLWNDLGSRLTANVVSLTAFWLPRLLLSGRLFLSAADESLAWRC